jgi:hypothetical protein
MNKFLKHILLLSVLVITNANISFASRLEEAKLFAHDIGAIWSYYQVSLAIIDYCEGGHNSNVARNFFIKNNKRVFTDANKLLVKRFGAKTAKMMFEKSRTVTSSSTHTQLNNLKQMSVANRQYTCADYLRQHMNRERDIKKLFSGQMERVFGVRRHLY